jgi:hypothetical protein
VAAVATLLYAVAASVLLRPARLGAPPVRSRMAGDGLPPQTPGAIVPIGMESRETLA